MSQNQKSSSQSSEAKLQNSEQENQSQPEKKPAEVEQPEYLPTGIQVYAELLAKHFRQAKDGEVPDQERTPEELLLRWSSQPPLRVDVDEFVIALKTHRINPVVETVGTDMKLFYKLITI